MTIAAAPNTSLVRMDMSDELEHVRQQRARQALVPTGHRMQSVVVQAAVGHIDDPTEIDVAHARVGAETLRDHRRERALLVDMRVGDVRLRDDDHAQTPIERVTYGFFDRAAVLAPLP